MSNLSLYLHFIKYKFGSYQNVGLDVSCLFGLCFSFGHITSGFDLVDIKLISSNMLEEVFSEVLNVCVHFFFFFLGKLDWVLLWLGLRVFGFLRSLSQFLGLNP